MADLDDIIRGSLEGLEGRDEDPGDALPSDESGTEEGTSEAGVEEIATAGAEGEVKTSEGKTKAAAVAEVEDKLAAELGFDPKKRKGPNQIPYPRVKEIVGNRERKILDRLAKTFGLDEAAASALKWDDAALDELFDTHHVKKVKGYEDEVGKYKGTLSEIQIVEQLMETDDRKFLTALANKYPQYQKYLDAVLSGSQPAAAKQTNEDTEPPLTNADGTTTVEMLQKHMTWRDGQSTKKFQKELDALKQRYEPLIERERARDIDRQSGDATAKLITEARKSWPGFKENEQEIFDYFTSSKENISVRDAYNEIRYRKTQAELEAAKKASTDAEKRGREKTLEELKAANPRDTSVAASETDKVSDVVVGEADPITAAIKRSIAGLKR